jgi:hypothetical protein
MTPDFLRRLNRVDSETIEAIKTVLHQHRRIKAMLAANYHHALFSLFYPATPVGQFQFLDEQVAAGLIVKRAEVEGLPLRC